MAFECTLPRAALAVGMLGVGLLGCEHASEGGPIQRQVMELGAEAKADLKSEHGGSIGEVYLRKTEAGVLVTAEVDRGTPGMHGIHIHAQGDCSDLAGKSMGGHFAPREHSHALPAQDAEQHLGDLGNIQIGEDGQGVVEVMVDHASLDPDDANNLIGRSVILHAGKDEGAAKQPSGDSGPAVACGVIQAS